MLFAVWGSLFVVACLLVVVGCCSWCVNVVARGSLSVMCCSLLGVGLLLWLLPVRCFACVLLVECLPVLAWCWLYVVGGCLPFVVSCVVFVVLRFVCLFVAC